MSDNEKNIIIGICRMCGHSIFELVQTCPHCGDRNVVYRDARGVGVDRFPYFANAAGAPRLARRRNTHYE